MFKAWAATYVKLFMNQSLPLPHLITRLGKVSEVCENCELNWKNWSIFDCEDCTVQAADWSKNNLYFTARVLTSQMERISDLLARPGGKSSQGYEGEPWESPDWRLWKVTYPPTSEWTAKGKQDFFFERVEQNPRCSPESLCFKLYWNIFKCFLRATGAIK